MATARRDAVSVWSSGLILAVLAAFCTALVAFTHYRTSIQIAANERAYLEQSLASVLDGVSYDNDLSESSILIPIPHGLPGAGPATVYRAYNEHMPVAALFVVTARDGFTGPIKLLVGIDSSGRITSVGILEHRETPGLGDLIEPGKSDWIRQFRNASLNAPPDENWAIKRDGGVFDQLTGASVTPRAIIKAIKTTLVYFEANRNTVFRVEEPQQDESPQ